MTFEYHGKNPACIKFKLIDPLVMSQLDYRNVIYQNYLTVELKRRRMCVPMNDDE